MEQIKTWLKNAKTYPPSEIFHEKYGKEAKAEERIKALCEEVYRFCFPENVKNPLSDLSQSFRDLEVAYVIGFDKIKPEYVQAVKEKFLADAKYAINALETLFKKDQILQQYYAGWKLKYQDLNRLVYDLTKTS
ncbi:hypothetical protein POP12_106 [Pectobacterium phage POP12]|nr:hypothetical protein POP12_106 [Pectobacterium phage POP12]